MTTSAAARWIVRPRPRPLAALRLVCFPYAGGGAQVYRTWPDALSAEIELLSIALPGRDARLREPLFRSMPPLVAALTDAIGGAIQPPFAIFGHSFGALLGFAFALELRRRGLTQPVQLFASGRRAPQLPEPRPMRDLPEPEFLAGLRRLGGIPDSVFDEPELMDYFLPILRADFAVTETTVLTADPPLDYPIVALGGTDDDRASPDELDGWRIHTAAGFDRELFPGGHFFLQTDRAGLLAALARRLARITAAR